jgi:hypothetical protein
VDHDTTPDPWYCRRCGKGLDAHEHISGGEMAVRERFRCPGTGLRDVFQPGDYAPLDDEIWYAPGANPYRRGSENGREA